MILRRFAGGLRCARGTAAMEFALTAPILLVLTGGVVEFGAAFSAFKTANRLASQYAITWADCKDLPAGSCLLELAVFADSYTVGNVAPQLKPTQLTLQIFQIRMIGTSPVVAYSYPVATTLTTAQRTAAQSAFSDGQNGVLVTVSYNHSLQFFSALMSPYLASQLTAAYTVTQLKS